MNKKRLEIFIKILIGATFFVPLILAPDNYIFPFIVPKILLFRSLVVLMLSGYVLLLACNWQEYKLKLTPVNAAVGLFFISFTISTFVGVDWYKSFWDNHERMLGLFTIFHYMVYYLVITSVVKEWRDWKWLLRTFLFAGVVVMIIGGLQKLSPDLLLNRGSGRVSATLGNAIYFSGYGLFLFFIGLLLTVKEHIQLRSRHSGGQAGSVFWFWYAVVGGIFGLLGIFLGQTRGTLLGLMAAGLVLLIGYLLTVKEAKKIRLILIVLLLFGLAGMGLLFVFRKSETVSQIPVLGSLLNSSFASGTGQTRAMAWQIALEAAKEKPIFGWGPNNYYYAFNKYYKPEFLEHGWGETWFDNAHSAIFNTLAVQGSVGLLTYIGLFLTPLIMLWRGWKRGLVDKHLAVIGSAFLVGHFVHNAVVFENPTSYLYFFFFLAFFDSLITNVRERGMGNGERGFSLGLGVIVALFVVILVYTTNINPARANMASLDAIKALQTGQMVVEAYKKAADIPSPHIDDIRSDFVRSVILIIPQYIKVGLVDKAKGLYQLGYEESKKNLVLHPLDIRTHMQFAQLVQQAVMELKESAQLMLEAEAVLKQALIISPKRQQIRYQLAMLELQISNPEYAAALLQEAVDDDPRIGESWWRLALVYAHSGNNKKAQEIIKTAQDKGIQFDAQGQNVVSMIMEVSRTSK